MHIDVYGHLGTAFVGNAKVAATGKTGQPRWDVSLPSPEPKGKPIVIRVQHVGRSCYRIQFADRTEAAYVLARLSALWTANKNLDGGVANAICRGIKTAAGAVTSALAAAQRIREDDPKFDLDEPEPDA